MDTSLQVAAPREFIGRWREDVDSIDVALPSVLVGRDEAPGTNVALDIAITACAIASLLLVPGLLLLTNAR